MAAADAVIAHQSPGRLRVRVSGHHGDRRFFEDLAGRLRECPDIRQIAVNPSTGSVLIQHDSEANTIVEFGAAHDLFSLAASDGHRHVLPSDAALHAFHAVDSRLQYTTAGNWNLREIAFFVLSIGGLMQMARQHFWPAGFTLFWYATALLQSKDRERRLPPM